MNALAFVHSYVKVDRLVFRQLEGAGLDDICKRVNQHLKEEGGDTAFDALCRTRGVEEREILWFLAGCEGLPGFGGRVLVESSDAKAKNKKKGIPRASPTAQLFGRNAELLKSNLDAIRETADIIENIQRSPFGLFGSMENVFIPSTPDTLRSYASLIEAVQSDFGQGTEWFLNIAKARLVIHVTHRTGDPHDEEVSSLIAAITGKEHYGQENQETWRGKYNYLVSDTRLDPYTTQTPAERENRNRELNELLKNQGQVFNDVLAKLTQGFLTLYQSRFPSQK